MSEDLGPTAPTGPLGPNGRPRRRPREGYCDWPVSTRLAESDYDRLCRLARERNMSLSKLLRTLFATHPALKPPGK